MRRMQTEELISAIASAASGAAAGVTALGTRVTKAEDDIDGNTGQIAANSTDIAANTAAITAITARVTTAEGDIAALETSKADQSSLDATNTAVASKAAQTALDATNSAVASKAAQTALDATNSAVASKAAQTALDATNSAVAAKADKTTITVDTTTTAAVLAGVNNTETRYQATLASLTLSAITAPAANAEYIFGIVFTSGTTATTLTNTLGATFTGDATASGVLTPVASKGYNLVIWWDGAAWQGVAREA